MSFLVQPLFEWYDLINNGYKCCYRVDLVFDS